MGESPRISELKFLNQICAKFNSQSAKDEKLNKLISTFGQRFKKAWDATQKRKVKKYVFKPSNRVVWIVVGKIRDYLILPKAEFCTCDDFYFRIMDKQAHLCYHLIAQKLAECMNIYDIYEEDDSLYETLMNDWTKAID